ncbi:hypothetical protein CHUAL_003572 [Chamberlinius hualienensis]
MINSKTSERVSIYAEAGLIAIIKWYKFYGFNIEAQENVALENQKKIPKTKFFNNRYQVAIFIMINIVISLVTVGSEIYQYFYSKVEAIQLSLTVAALSSLLCNAFLYIYTAIFVKKISHFIHLLATIIVHLDQKDPANNQRFGNISRNVFSKMSKATIFFIVTNIIGTFAMSSSSREAFRERFDHNNNSFILYCVVYVLILLAYIFVLSMKFFATAEIVAINSIIGSIIKEQLVENNCLMCDTNCGKTNREEVSKHQIQHAQLNHLVKHADECYAQRNISLLIADLAMIVFFTKGLQWKIFDTCGLIYSILLSIVYSFSLALKAYVGSNVNSLVSYYVSKGCYSNTNRKRLCTKLTHAYSNKILHNFINNNLLNHI